ncbi:MAG TPA: AAA family ATPase [Candidatus Binatus sp.]|uniref:ATP-binding protein n=1 Tax=Candidatus Binatus sp. TaxID=2811406 RepID=UPI002F410A65
MTSRNTFDRQPSHNAFVGRERELAELLAGLDDVGAGHGKLFLLSGEPGIGKTRLAEEISDEAAARGMRVLWGRCWEGGGAPAYWPFIQILRACVDDRDGEDLKALLGSGASEIARLIPEIRLSLPSLEEAKATTDAESARFRLFDSVATLLKNVARSEPLLIVIDDLHDADQPSLQMLRFVARESKDSRMLIVGTYRDAEVRQSSELGKLIGDLIREGRTVSIAGLSQAEVGEFIERSSATKADDKLAADLYRATEGNPLFVDGVVRLLAAEGKLARTAFDASAFKIPDGVRESIRRQLAALSEEAKALLSIASVVGNEFDIRLLEMVSGRSPEQIVEQTDEAVRLGVLRAGAPGFARQQFSHALIREVLYDDLAANRRIQLHGKIGAAIEEIYKGDLKPHRAQLAYHFRAAGVAGKAIDYSIDAGEVAYRIFAYEDAKLSWQAALQLMEQHNIEPQNQARLLERLATLMYVTDLSDPKGMEYLARALKIYEESGQTERAALVHSRMGAALAMRSAIRNPSEAMEHYRKAEAILGKGVDSARKANLYAGMAMAALHLMLREESLAWSRVAMDISERIRNEEIWINASCLQAIQLFHAGRLARALTLVDEASNRANRLVDAPSVHSAAWNSAALRVTLLDPTEAPFWLHRELAKPRLAHVTTPRLLLLAHLFDAYVESGELDQARRIWEEADLSSSFVAVRWHIATGEFEQAEIHVARNLEQARRVSSRDEQGSIANHFAKIRQLLGDLAGAERLGRIADEERDVPGLLHSGSFLAGIYAEMGCPERGHPHLSRCREILGNGEDWRGLAGKVARAEAVVAAAEGKYEDAETQFEKAVQIFRQYHVPFEEAEARHYWGRALNASGASARANEKLDAAIEIYRRCGAGERWVERVEADRPASPSRTERQEHPEDAQGPAIFRREGEYWTVAYEGKTWRLKDAKGYHYIAHLLGRPGEEIRALDLATGSGGASEEVTDAATAEDLARTGVLAGDLGHAGEMLDAPAKADYQRRLTELEDELEEAREFKDEERIATAEDEKAALAHEIRRAVGLGGRDRRAASSAERARVAVTRAIRLALERISEQNSDLGRLLSTTIKTGAVCSYVPDDRFPVSWRL